MSLTSPTPRLADRASIFAAISAVCARSTDVSNPKHLSICARQTQGAGFVNEASMSRVVSTLHESFSWRMSHKMWTWEHSGACTGEAWSASVLGTPAKAASQTR